MRNADFLIKQVGEFLQSFLGDMPITGVAAATIAKQQQLPGIGIVLVTLQFPPMRRAFRWPKPCFLNSLRTVCRLAEVPISAKWRLISRRDRLVHNTPSRIGSPAVNSACSLRKFSSNNGFCSLAHLRPAPFFLTRLSARSSLSSNSIRPRRTVLGSIWNNPDT